MMVSKSKSKNSSLLRSCLVGQQKYLLIYVHKPFTHITMALHCKWRVETRFSVSFSFYASPQNKLTLHTRLQFSRFSACRGKGCMLNFYHVKTCVHVRFLCRKYFGEVYYITWFPHHHCLLCKTNSKALIQKPTLVIIPFGK